MSSRNEKRKQVLLKGATNSHIALVLNFMEDMNLNVEEEVVKLLTARFLIPTLSYFESHNQLPECWRSQTAQRWAIEDCLQQLEGFYKAAKSYLKHDRAASVPVLEERQSLSAHEEVDAPRELMAEVDPQAPPFLNEEVKTTLEAMQTNDRLFGGL